MLLTVTLKPRVPSQPREGHTRWNSSPGAGEGRGRLCATLRSGTLGLGPVRAPYLPSGEKQTLCTEPLKWKRWSTDRHTRLTSSASPPAGSDISEHMATGTQLQRSEVLRASTAGSRTPQSEPPAHEAQPPDARGTEQGRGPGTPTHTRPHARAPDEDAPGGEDCAGRDRQQDLGSASSHLTPTPAPPTYVIGHHPGPPSPLLA